MEENELLKRVDHTLLKQCATWEQIKEICDDAMKYKTASVCIPPSFVKKVKAYVQEHMAVCTVIGFPNGYATTAVKVFETKDAIENGADEIDMVINLGQVKEADWDGIQEELKAVRKASTGKIMKVIIETCLLTKNEKIKLCELVTDSGADFIKTSTGFSEGGATFEDVKLLRQYVGSQVKVKAAGGISSLEDAKIFVSLGADRLGTSKVVNIIKSR